MSFLPEEDQEFLQDKKIGHELLEENLPDGTRRRAVRFPELGFAGNLYQQKEGGLVVCRSCEVVVLIPTGYATTRLDSFYTIPWLKRPDGSNPNAAASETELFGRKWQFWSRHLDGNDWRDGVDGLRTYLPYIQRELRVA